MVIVEPEVFVEPFNSELMLSFIERMGRTCYKSEAKITQDSASKFVRSLVRSGHESVIEHAAITVRFIVDRGVSHEIVRHRIASYSQESTRYCAYKDNVVFIRPFLFEEFAYRLWEALCEKAENYYLALLDCGVSPQWARSVLPNSLKTELVMTANLREWRHFFRVRCAAAAHPQMQQVAIPLRNMLAEALPEVFDDVPYNTEFPYKHYARVSVAEWATRADGDTSVEGEKGVS